MENMDEVIFKKRIRSHHHHGITITNSSEKAEIDGMAQNVNKSQHGRPHNLNNNENCCHGITGLHTISEEVCKAMYWFSSLYFAPRKVETVNIKTAPHTHCAIMIQITGWKCTSGLCTWDEREHFPDFVVWSVWCRHFWTYRYCELCEDGLLKIDRWTEEWAYFFSDTALTDVVSFCQCCWATLHLPSTVCFWRKFFFQQNAVSPHYHNVSNFLNDHSPGSSIVHCVKAKYLSLCPYLMFLRYLLVGNHIN